MLPLDLQTQCFLFDVQCCGATTTANGRFLRKTAFYNKKFLISGGCKVGVENFCTKLPKDTPLRQIWSNKSQRIRKRRLACSHIRFAVLRGALLCIAAKFGVPFNISATSEDIDFKLGMQLEFAKAHHKIPPRRKRGRGTGLGELPKFGVFPLIFMQWLKVSTSNLVHSLGGQVGPS